MIEACRVNGVKLQLGFMRRFDRSFRRGKEMLDSGAVGKVTLLKSNTYGPSEPKPWMFDVHRNYGPIGEVNSHDFDTLRWYAAIHEVFEKHKIARAVWSYREMDFGLADERWDKDRRELLKYL